MNSFTRWLILAILIIAAVACYSYGSSTGIFIFIIAGVGFELAFWFGIFSRKKKRSS
jgi:hypothetical protein